MHCSAVVGGPGRAAKGHQLVVQFTTMVHYSVSESWAVGWEWEYLSECSILEVQLSRGFWISSLAFWIIWGTSGIVASLDEKGAASLEIPCLLFYGLMQTVKETRRQNMVPSCVFLSHPPRQQGGSSRGVCHPHQLQQSFHSPYVGWLQWAEGRGLVVYRKNILGTNPNTALACPKTT